MLLRRIPNTIPSRRSPLEDSRPNARGVASGRVALLLFLLLGCGGSSGSGPGGGATLSGTVRTAAPSAVLEGATISAGTRHATSDASGHFELTDLSEGSAIVKAQQAGYLPETATVSISAGANTHDFALTAQEIYVSGAYAVYVPAGVGPMRGVIISLGGGVTTSGFVTGGPLEPGNPVLEQSLQALGASLRNLAKSAHVALLGTTTHAIADNPASDISIFGALATTAASSGHAELTNAPFLTFGLDAGSLESAGLASRVPQRAIGVLMRVPTDVPTLTAPSTLAVPTFVMLSGLDDSVGNSATQTKFLGNRSRGGLWSLAVEPGVQHAEATPLGNAANVGWIAAALAARLPTTLGDSLIALDETSGWLGDQTTLDIATWAGYAGNRALASWLLSQASAQSWQTLGGGGGGGAAHGEDERGR